MKSRRSFMPARLACLPLLLALPLVMNSLQAEQIDVLVLGSSRSFSSDSFSGLATHQQAFNPQLVVDRLQDILNADPEYTNTDANVVFEDIYQSTTRGMFLSNYTVKGYSLQNYYYWPNGRAARLNNLKGAGGTAWDYVIIMGDPSFITTTPGVYANGVRLIVDTIKQGTAKPILMMQWPHAGSTVPVADFAEVTYRVGDSGAIPVAPAGYAWDALTNKDTGTHPTPKGAYLAAATLYHKIKSFEPTGNTSTFNYPGDGQGALADLAYNAVYPTVAPVNYTGNYNKADPYHILQEKSRVIKSDKGNGTSTEAGFLDWGNYNGGRYFKALLRPQLSINDFGDDNGYSGLTHFHIGRAFGGTVAYRVWPATYKYSMGFPYQIRNQDSDTGDGGTDMLYGSDTLVGNRGDQLVAFTMISNGEVASGIRNLPVHALWAASKDEHSLSSPFIADGNHYGADVNEAVVSYMMTLLTGRCPIGKNGTEQERARRRIGYEASWVMSTLNLRPPGFSVHPSAHNAKTITPNTTETMSVYFVNPPQSAVTVSASPSANTAAIVNPKTLTFDATNHDTIQNVKVTGLPGASASEAFDVNFTSASNDMCFANLSDSWKYTNTRTTTGSVTVATQADRQVAVPKNGSKLIDLQVVGSLEANTAIADPFHGTLTWNGGSVVYTPDADYIGNDSFAFAVNVGGTLTKGYIQITVEDLPTLIITESGGNTQVAEGGAADTYTIALNEAPAQNITVTVILSPDSQLTVSPSTPLTFNSTNWSDAQTVTVTAVNDDSHEFEHQGTISHTTSSTDANWNELSITDVTAAITDDDNQAPTVNAGSDQTVYMAGTAWTPANMTSSVVAWYDANDLSTIAKDGNNKVSQWSDKSGRGNNAVQSAGGAPTYTATDSIANNMPSIGNPGASSKVGLLTPPMGAKNVYVVTYFKDGVDTTFDNYCTLLSGNGSYGSYRVMGHTGQSNFFNTSHFNDAGTYRNGSTTSTFDGALAMPATIYKFKASALRTQPYALGYNQAEVSRDWLGAQCEWIFTDGTEDSATEKMIEGYLAHKWGLVGNLPLGHSYKVTPPGDVSTTANLSGTVSNPDGDPTAIAWTHVGGTGSGTVTFADPSAVSTTVTFTQTGTYILQLAADDGYGPIYDQVTITVVEPQTYTSWINGYSVGGLTGFGDDADGDGISNCIENYFGTDPSAASIGIEVGEVASGASTTFTFTHPISTNPATDITAAYRWSKDLANFHADGVSSGGTTVTFTQGAPSNGRVTVTATVTGSSDRVFVALEVTQD